MRARLRAFIEQEFGTLYQLHRRLGVKLSTANGWLGKKLPGLASLTPLVAYGLSLDWLYRGKGLMRYEPPAPAAERRPAKTFREALRLALVRSEGARFEETCWDQLSPLRTAAGEDVVLALSVEGVRPLYRELVEAYRATMALRTEALALEDPESRTAMLAFAERQWRTFRPKHSAIEFIGWTGR